MEKPYNGRAIFQDNVTELQIIIPAKKNWFVIIFLGAWICGWLMGESFALVSVSGLFHGSSVGSFIVFGSSGGPREAFLHSGFFCGI